MLFCNLSDSQTSVITNDFSHTCHCLLGVRGGRPVWAGVIFKRSALLLKREYHSNVFDRLRQDSPKAACSISYVSTPVFPRQKQKSMHTRSVLSPPSWNATHTVVDVHPMASTDRMQGDTDLWFCTYTCTELSRIPLCCHFATYYNFPEKKISPGIKWSAHIDVTECFIAPIICSKCFGHLYAHHQELKTIYVITAYGVQCLVAGCRGSGAGSRLCVQEEGCCTTQCQGVHHLQSYYNRDGVCRYCAPGTEYLSRLNIGISLWRERRGATLRLSGYPVCMGVWRYENRAAKSVVFRDIAVDTRPSVVTSVRTCFAVPRPKMNLDDWKENDLSGHSMKHKR
jgi:hypothetical protein